MGVDQAYSAMPSPPTSSPGSPIAKNDPHLDQDENSKRPVVKLLNSPWALQPPRLQTRVHSPQDLGNAVESARDYDGFNPPDTSDHPQTTPSFLPFSGNFVLDASFTLPNDTSPLLNKVRQLDSSQKMDCAGLAQQLIYLIQEVDGFAYTRQGNGSQLNGLKTVMGWYFHYVCNASREHFPRSDDIDDCGGSVYVSMSTERIYIYYTHRDLHEPATPRNFSVKAGSVEKEEEEKIPDEEDARGGDARGGDAREEDAREEDAREEGARGGDTQEEDARGGDTQEEDAREGDAREGDTREGDTREGDVREGGAREEDTREEGVLGGVEIPEIREILEESGTPEEREAPEDVEPEQSEPERLGETPPETTRDNPPTPQLHRKPSSISRSTLSPSPSPSLQPPSSPLLPEFNILPKIHPTPAEIPDSVHRNHMKLGALRDLVDSWLPEDGLEGGGGDEPTKLNPFLQMTFRFMVEWFESSMGHPQVQREIYKLLDLEGDVDIEDEVMGYSRPVYGDEKLVRVEPMRQQTQGLGSPRPKLSLDVPKTPRRSVRELLKLGYGTMLSPIFEDPGKCSPSEKRKSSDVTYSSDENKKKNKTGL